MNMPEHRPLGNRREITPCIIMLDRSFLLGVIYGIDLGRRISIPTDPNKGRVEPIYMGNEDKREDFDAMYHGSLLQLDCAHCGRIYTFDDPREIPSQNLICDTDGCGNVLILYGVPDIAQMRIGNQRLVG